MKFFSTNKQSPGVSFFVAMKNGLAPDGGLYMPEEVPVLPGSFWNTLSEKTFTEISFEMARLYLGDEMSDAALASVVEDAFTFPVSLRSLGGQHHILELFHGPTLAFKDVGARFMARLFSEAAKKQGEEVTILVATSGDTGSAVAHGFYKVPGVRVCLLFPKGKVSRLQEKQMATLGENITAVEVDGVFDDCQRLVKEAFLDADLNRRMRLSSANSINIARLLPQSFYYAYAWSRIEKQSGTAPVFSVPSGNFGNLTGGILAMKMGMPVEKFIAATNVNDVVPHYLKGNPFDPKPSVQTISNAMDVGNPSNFVRIFSLFDESDAEFRKHISGFSYSDEETLDTISAVYDQEKYLLCPHTAIGYRAAGEYKRRAGREISAITLATAHPVKFKDVLEPAIGQPIEIPERLQVWLDREKKSEECTADYRDFKDFLLSI